MKEPSIGEIPFKRWIDFLSSKSRTTRPHGHPMARSRSRTSGSNTRPAINSRPRWTWNWPPATTTNILPAKAKAGFVMYALPEDAARLRPAMSDPEIMQEISSL